MKTIPLSRGDPDMCTGRKKNNKKPRTPNRITLAIRNQPQYIHTTYNLCQTYKKNTQTKTNLTFSIFPFSVFRFFFQNVIEFYTQIGGIGRKQLII